MARVSHMPATRIALALAAGATLSTALIAGLGGCRAASPTPAEFASGVKDIMPKLSDQPWAGPAERATLTSDEPKFDFTRTAFDASWTWQGGQNFIDPFWVARRIGRDLDRLPTPVEADGSRRVYRYDDTFTIVCVNPVVVLIEPKPSTTTAPSGKVARSAFGELIGTGSKAIELPGAMRSGTSVASIDGLKYYAPGKTEEPEPVEVNEDGVGAIDVPWGTLEVRPDVFNGYSVRAVAAQ